MTKRSKSDPDTLLLEAFAARLAAVGARLSLEAPGIPPIHTTDDAQRGRRTHVIFRNRETLQALARGDHLALAEAYLEQKIDVEGDLLEVMKVTHLIELGLSWREKVGLALRLYLRNRVDYERESIAFHYDRPAEFFLPWFDRWRSYSHGFYESPDDSLSDAQARKLQFVVDALGLKPGMRVLDMGAGWGCFLEYAGLQGIEVHGITISETQFAFVQKLIEEKNLPCTIELANFHEYRPAQRFDGAVFIGTLEHVPAYDEVATFLAKNLEPKGRFYADFCAQRSEFRVGSFMGKYIWPGPTQYVSLQRLVEELVVAGFNIKELRDDTLNYAYTVRDWGDLLESQRKTMASRWGEATIRAFLLFLRGSYHFLETSRTQAYHIVAGRDAATLQARPIGVGSGPGWK